MSNAGPAISPDVQAMFVAALPRLRRFARTLCRNTHDADDLVQLALERALLRFDQWRPDSSLVNWLFGIVRHAFLDELRSRRRRDRIFATEAEAEHVGESSMERTVTQVALQSAMAELPDEQRLAIGLVLVEGLSYKEAAEIMQVPVGTLTSRLARARMALAARLTDNPESTR